MDEAEARVVLGVGQDADEQEIRAAFRHRLRQAHPDVRPADPTAATATARLVRAYAVLRRPPSPQTARWGAVDPTDARAGSEPTPVPTSLTVDGDSLTYPAPPDEVYRRLIAAADQLGELTYVDPDARLLDTVVTMDDGTACSLLATLQGRAQGTEVFCTLEPLGREPCPPVGPLVAALAGLLAQGSPSIPYVRP